MRTIKFRGKDINKEQWCFGSLLTNYYEFDKPQTYSIVDKEDYHFPVIPETVGQFTGLHDVNGKEIYEGDILGFGSDTSIGLEVYWSEQRFAYCVRTNLLKEDRYTLAELQYGYKVIGNIHDNPELIK
jgi:uncharacterized phage protein (TIGR01671 family)